MKNLENMDYRELQAAAKELGIKKVVGVKKDELVKQINEAKTAAAKTAVKRSLGSIIYANMAKAHPDWDNRRVYAATKGELAKRSEQRRAKSAQQATA